MDDAEHPIKKHCRDQMCCWGPIGKKDVKQAMKINTLSARTQAGEGGEKMANWRVIKGYTDYHKLLDETGRLVGSVDHCRYDGSDSVATVYDPNARLIGYYPDPNKARAAVQKEVARLRRKKAKKCV